MTTQQNSTTSKTGRIFDLLKQAVQGKELDFTQGSMRRAVLLLAIPMMLEMIMESVFALVDLYFVGHLHNSSEAIQTVGLTESVLAIIYSLAVGMSMAATAVVARRIGEKDPVEAAKAGMQAILVAVFFNLILSIAGYFYAREILMLMGASAATATAGTPFIQIMMCSSTIIVLLFLINGIFRGAGNAAIAMKSLWVANIVNIILCPVLINGFGPIPAFGLTGAALATTIGRATGVCYQLYQMVKGKSQLKIKLAYLYPHFKQITALLKIAIPAVFQFFIASCSWIFLAQLVATTGGDHGSAGYQTAIRLMMFFMLPAWGLSGAASTLVGQNLGAKNLKRAEDSVWQTTKYIIIYMGVAMVLCLLAGHFFISFFTDDVLIRSIAAKGLNIMSMGFLCYGVGMVMTSTFNGAGDTATPTMINFFGFWIFQIPLAYILAKHFNLGPDGVFIAIPVAETGIAIAAYILFKRGRWKTMQV
ncbi:putative MATE family efflux protein [Pedobacter cryoconitis]|uniref:Multidrug-efflux transporter n=1 Tax=Pedobacter cryoconitis TaxID=188932 RepID=A0A7W9E0V7_9SPHI|nr:MATE family efflux transporter [Pedobacter cryoconitis]MBB5637015.1 putative MATE family efflux protein [Pedobacter cryoconitis]